MNTDPNQETSDAEARVDPAFWPLLRDFDLPAIEQDESAIFGVWADLRLAYANRACARLAAGGAPALLQRFRIGESVAPEFGEPLADWSRALLSGPRRLFPDGVVYPRASPLLERESQLTAFPLSGEGLLLVHSLPHEAPRPRPDRRPEPSEAVYRNDAGFVVQCSHCRRFRAPDADRWDWSDAWFERAPRQTSHGLCKVCVAIHYPP